MTAEFDDAELPKLIAVALEARDGGLERSLEDICEESPHLIDAVRQALDLSHRIPDLRRVAAGRDRYVSRTLAERYRLDSRVGSGAMGVVYKGWDAELERPVAVKILKLPFGDEEGAESRFAREAETLAAISHEAIVRIHDRGRTGDDDPFLVMEFVDGASLSQLLVEIKAVPGNTTSKDTTGIAHAIGAESLGDRSYLRTAVRWMAEVANGLAIAHRKGIFHRDVKPSNILIGRNGNPVLVDFGIAAQSSRETITKDGDLIGTPAFMAPEALQEKVTASPALDVYGLTATLYELLTLRPPYAGTPTQVLAALGQRDPVPAGQIGEGLPRDLLAILECGMARQPVDRYASMAELEEDLRAFLEHRPVQARQSTAIGRAWRRVSRSAAWRTGVAVGLVAVGLAAGSELLSARKEDRTAKYWDVAKHIRPDLGVSGAALRVLTLDEGRLETLERLDQAVALCDGVFPATLTRAMVRFDHGILQGAAQDMGQIASAVGTAYTRALHERYRDWAKQGGGTALDLSELPEPETGMDKYVGTVIALRARDFGAAIGYLKDPELKEFIPAQELATLLIGDRGKQLERATWLEERIGRRTANTANLISIPLALMQDYGAAYEVMQDGLELAPTSHTLHFNAGRVAWKLGLHADAAEHYRQVIGLRPDNKQGHEMYVRFLTETGSIDEAQVALDAAPLGEEDPWRALRHELQGGIEAERALEFHFAELGEEARASVLLAEEQFGKARSLGRVVNSPYSRLSTGILNGDDNPAFSAVIESVISRPWQERQIERLEASLPERLDEEQTLQIGRMLSSFRTAIVSRELTEKSESPAEPEATSSGARN